MPSTNAGLKNARKQKNDEFYTLYADIEREIQKYIEYNPNVFKDKTILLPCDDPEQSNFTKYFAQNFERFGIKKLISTSYAKNSKIIQHSLFDSVLEKNSPNYDRNKSDTNGKIFILEKDNNGDKRINIDDLEWQYLKGDGDFRSAEIKKIRDEADIIITNPPFSLFREFIAWIFQANKQFLLIANQNIIGYKEVFPLIKANKMWCGTRLNQRINGKNMTFIVPNEYKLNGTEVFEENGIKYVSVAGTGWFTNLDHGRRHEPLQLMTMEDNIKFSSHKDIREQGYLKYDNYDAIEVPYVDAIPSDYDGIMGVPISFINKYCPEQFEILGTSRYHDNSSDANDINFINGKGLYTRILIKHRR